MAMDQKRTILPRIPCSYMKTLASERQVKGMLQRSGPGERNTFRHPCRLKQVRWRHAGTHRSMLGHTGRQQYPHRDACCTALSSTAHTVFYIQGLSLKLRNSDFQDDEGQTQEPDDTRKPT